MTNPYTLSRADRARYDLVLRTIGAGGARGIVSELIAALDQGDDAWSMRVLANLARAGMRRELQLHAARAPAEISNASTMRVTDLLQRIQGSSPNAASAIERLVHYATEGAGYDWRRRYQVWDPLSQRPTPN